MQDLFIEMQQARKQLNNCITFYKNCGRELAQAEMNYRIALRKEILKLKVEDNAAWSVCADLAKGNKEVAKLRLEKDIKKSDYECTYEKILQLKQELKIIDNEIQAERKGM